MSEFDSDSDSSSTKQLRQLEKVKKQQNKLGLSITNALQEFHINLMEIEANNHKVLKPHEKSTDNFTERTI